LLLLPLVAPRSNNFPPNRGVAVHSREIEVGRVGERAAVADGEDTKGGRRRRSARPGECLERFRGLQSQIQAAVAGRPLRILITYVDEDPAVVLRIMVTRDGHIVAASDDEPFTAHVDIQGSAESIRRVLTNEIELYEAVVARIVVLRIDLDEVEHFAALRELVASTLTKRA
jgi:hypothetical protein